MSLPISGVYQSVKVTCILLCILRKPLDKDSRQNGFKLFSERGGVKLCSHSSIFRRKQGFNQLGALCYKILYLTEQSRILYCQWMIKFDRMYLLLVWLHAPSSRIRSRHFEEKDITNNRISPTAIPVTNTNISNNNNSNNFQKGQSCI